DSLCMGVVLSTCGSSMRTAPPMFLAAPQGTCAPSPVPRPTVPTASLIRVAPAAPLCARELEERTHQWPGTGRLADSASAGTVGGGTGSRALRDGRIVSGPVATRHLRP